MKFSDFVVYSAIQADLTAWDKVGAIREMFTALADAGAFPQQTLASCLALTMKREATVTSGLGAGVAIPLTACPEIEHGIASVFLSQRGLDFDSLDGEPVHVFFAIVKQPRDPEFHLRMMEYLSRALKLEFFASRLKRCRTRWDIIDCLDAADTVLAGAT